MRTSKSVPGAQRLLSVESDSKTVKGSEYGYLTGVLYLAPADEARKGINLCPKASEECRQACLYGAGMAAVFPSIKRSRVERTLWLLDRPEEFKAQLRADIQGLIRQAKLRGMIPAVRINGTSDLPKLALEMAAEFPNVQFYDYTKIPRPWTRTRSNYHLTFSFDGLNHAECLSALKNGVNVAVVFATSSFPQTWNGHRVIDGDKNDLRFLDPEGVIVGLKAKGGAKKLEIGGFVQIAGVA